MLEWYPMGTHWKVAENTQHRKYVEKIDADFLPFLAHVGWNRFLEAQQPLAQHYHHDAMEICYIRRGNPVFQVDEELYRTAPKRLFVSYPEDFHGTGGNPMERMDLYWLALRFDENENLRGLSEYPEYASMLRPLLETRRHLLPGSDGMADTIFHILNLFLTDDPMLRPLSQAHILLLLREIAQLTDNSGKHEPSGLIGECRLYIDRHIYENLRLEELAESCGLALSHFKRRFRDEVGIPPGEYVIRRKVECARDRLLKTDARIIEIAYDLGFSSSQYFSTVFRRYTGRTPSELRESQD